MDTNNLFGEVLESAGTAVKQTGKAVASAVSDTAQQAASQAGVPVGDSTVPSQDAATQVSNEEVVESLYGKSQPQNTNPQTPLNQSGQIPAGSGNTQEELAKTREELTAAYKQHTETYYDPTFNPPKREEEEESVSEKLKRQDQQGEVDLQKKEMEKPPELVQRAAQRIEKFPGASG